MEICDFTYHRPTSLDEACALGRELGASARYLAGGTDVLVDLKTQRYGVEHLVALDRVEDLSAIRADDDGLHIGGMATLSAVANSEAVHNAFVALPEAISRMAAVQIRNRGTIGGNFCAAVPCADTPPICVAGGAKLRIVGSEGERWVGAADFFTGPRQTVLERCEVLAEILIPPQPSTSGARYERFGRRCSSVTAVASVAARLVLEEGRIADARVVLGAVAPTPLLVRAASKPLHGSEPSETLFAEAARIAADAARPITDVRGTEDFRRSLVETLTLRALREAQARATEGR